MFYISETCPICRAGAIGFRTCSDGSTLVLMCNECDAVWTNPEAIAFETANFPSAPDYIVNELDCSISGGASEWATRDAIEKVQWGELINGEGNP